MGLKITIIGKVHDVGYRLLLLELADLLFIEKFDARNVKIDGKEAVVVLVDGDEGQLNEFVEMVKSEKPEMAVVEEIKVEEYKGRIRDIERFRASFNTVQLSKIVQVGLKMLEKQDQMLQNQDLMLNKMDVMLQKQEETIWEIREVKEIIREEGEKTRSYLGLRIDESKEYLANLTSSPH
ncbi:acylphosphatase [Archaeoglobus sp.]